MKIGLLFGTFNPVHNGHIAIADYMVEHADLQEVWMIVSPQNPLKNSDSLLPEDERLNMVNLAIGNYKKIKTSDVEFDLPKPSYTINTLRHLREKFPQHEFVIIMGADNLEIFKKWKGYEKILDAHKIYVYPRQSSDGGELKNHPRVKFIPAPLMQISATFIRKSIKEKKDVRSMLDENVLSYIKKMHFYE